VTVVDPRHPLYGRTLPLIDITNKQYLGRSCVVWIQEGVERIVPLAATDRAPESVTIYPFPLNPFSVRQLVSAYGRIASQITEATEDGSSQHTSDRAQDGAARIEDTETSDIVGGCLELVGTGTERSGIPDHCTRVSPIDARPPR
jgi:hypothetical protein